MPSEILILCTTAASIGIVHTVLGPDHYIPFIVMSRVRGWSAHKTVLITLICGIGHILSSVILGTMGIIFGIGIMKLEVFEAFRGNLAALMLIGFGFAYFVWGVRSAVKNRPHTHAHAHDELDMHLHEHSHNGRHVHVHDKKGTRDITPWILFTIFIFGPCEPLIPILMYPAAKNTVFGVFLVIGIFGVVTIGTMLGIVLISLRGISLVFFSRFERYAHAFAGATICFSGLVIQFLGL